MTKKKLPKYGFGSVLSSLSPLASLIPGVGAIAAPALSAIGNIIESGNTPTSPKPLNISTDPYKMKDGGKTKKAQIINDQPPAATEDILKLAGKGKELTGDLKSAKLFSTAGRVLTPITSAFYLKDKNYLKAGANAVPFLNETLDYAIPGWDSKEANEGIGNAFSKIPEAMNFLKDTVKKTFFEEGGSLSNNFKQYDSPSHENGGQPINEQGNVDYKNPSAEIEGTENKYKFTTLPDLSNLNYVFSDKNGTSKDANDIMKKFNNKNVDLDNPTKTAMELKLKKLMNVNEIINKLKGTNEPETLNNPQEEMSGGGGLNVITMNKEKDFQKELLKAEFGLNLNNTDNPIELGLNKGYEVPQFDPISQIRNTQTTPLLPRNQYSGDITQTLPNNQYTSQNLKTLPNVPFSPVSNLITQGLPDLPNFIDTPATANKTQTAKSLNINPGKVADVMKGGLAIYDTIKALTVKPDKVNPRLSDYGKADQRFNSMGVDMTQAYNQINSSKNAGADVINNNTTSDAVRMARLSGLNADTQNALGNTAMQEQQLRNQILGQQGQYEASKAQDISNRLVSADDKFAQNQAATRGLGDVARQTLSSYAGDFAKKQFAKDATSDVYNQALLKTTAGFNMLNSMVSDFKLDGMQEWKDYLTKRDDASLTKVLDAIKLKVK